MLFNFCGVNEFSLRYFILNYGFGFETSISREHFEVYSLTKCLQKLHLQFGPSQVLIKLLKISRVSADLSEFGK